MARPRLFDETEVLAKAAQLFWLQGYARTSIQDLVDHLGINRASIYNICKDKDDLYIKALNYYQKAGHQELRKVFEEEEDVRKGIETIFKRSFQSSEGKPSGCMLVNCTIEMAQDHKTILDFLKQNKQGFIKLIKAYLKTGVETGQISKEADLNGIAQYLYVFYNGLNVDTKLRPSPGHSKKIIQLALEVLDAK